jgi:hypothetical protein
MGDLEDENLKFETIKQLIDSFYFTFYMLGISNIYGHVVAPLVNKLIFRKGNTQRDITFGLSFLTTCLFYIGFFAPINTNIIPIVCIVVTVLVGGEIGLYYLGVVQPSQICFSVIANYMIVLFLGLLPISFSSLWMLKDNQMGIMAIRLGRKHKLANIVVSLGCLFYLLGSFIFVVLYRNSRFLRRI